MFENHARIVYTGHAASDGLIDQTLYQYTMKIPRLYMTEYFRELVSPLFNAWRIVRACGQNADRISCVLSRVGHA